MIAAPANAVRDRIVLTIFAQRVALPCTHQMCAVTKRNICATQHYSLARVCVVALIEMISSINSTEGSVKCFSA